MAPEWCSCRIDPADRLLAPGAFSCRTHKAAPPFAAMAIDSKTLPSLAPERALAGETGAPVCGIDEAGRGPLAGPVVAAAVIFTSGTVPAGINDSKKLTHNAREALFGEIMAGAQVGIGISDCAEIDEINILQATMAAMTRAVEALSVPPAAALIDGNRAPRLACPARTLVQGDALSLSIAAASIIAKVTRDRLMEELAGECPGYGWERNMGYGTAEHREALVRLGVTRHHRRSFGPVRALIGG
jgi:ribonuclease HII